MSLSFSGFEPDQERRQLLRSGRPVPLEPRAYELLCLLVGRRPRALSRAQIRDAVWPGVFIPRFTLGVVVNSIRQALDDDAREPRFFRTVHGFGYADERPAPAAPGAPRRRWLGPMQWAQRPFFSPDGLWVGFQALGGMLSKVSVSLLMRPSVRSFPVA